VIRVGWRDVAALHAAAVLFGTAALLQKAAQWLVDATIARTRPTPAEPGPDEAGPPMTWLYPA
jgi:hypothetical protein